jgi:hypothetical protein
MFFGGLLVLGARLVIGTGTGGPPARRWPAFIGAGLVGATASEVIQPRHRSVDAGGGRGGHVPCACASCWAAPAGTAGRAARSHSGAPAAPRQVALGFLVGGLLTDNSGWRAVFLGQHPAGLLLLSRSRSLVPPLPADRSARSTWSAPIMLIASVMALIVGASLWRYPDPRVAGRVLIAAGIGVGAGFAVQQRRARHPLVPGRPGHPPTCGPARRVVRHTTATTSSAGVLATLLMQQQFGVSAVRAGLLLLPFSLWAFIGGSALYTRHCVRPRLTTRRLAAVGLLGIAAGDLLLALTYGSFGGIVAGVIVAGTGLGIASVAGKRHRD